MIVTTQKLNQKHLVLSFTYRDTYREMFDYALEATKTSAKINPSQPICSEEFQKIAGKCAKRKAGNFTSSFRHFHCRRLFLKQVLDKI